MKKIIVFLLMLVLSCSVLADFKVLNNALNLPLLNKEGRWKREDLEQNLARYRLKLKGNEVRRSAFLRGYSIFGIPASEIVIVSNRNGLVEQIDIVFFNKGDFAHVKNLKKEIKNAYKRLREELTSILGNPERIEYGPKGMENDALEWKDGNVKFILEFNKREYTILHIGYGEDYSSQVEIQKLKKENFIDNIVKQGNGDVYIDNIPMVDQGQKGYCTIATMERVLRYYGITQVSQHQLAEAANTGKGGGTYINSLISSTRKLLQKHGLKMYSIGELNFDKIKKHIDNGAPILWGMCTNREYETFLQMSRAKRPKSGSLETYLSGVENYKIPNKGDHHICLIVGYNEATKEIAVTNSWGDRDMQPAWIPIEFAKKVSKGYTFAVGAKK